MEHTEQCKRQSAEIEKQQQRYREQWSNYCTDCNGNGGMPFSQPHPYGSTVAYEQLWDPCICIEEGRCPRCGDTHSLNEDGADCSACGWNGTCTGLPDQHECNCWEEEMRHQQEEEWDFPLPSDFWS